MLKAFAWVFKVICGLLQYDVHRHDGRKLRPRPHVSGDFCIRKFFYADTPSVHTCPPYKARCIRRSLYTLSRVEISVYTVYPDTCGRSYPYIFVYADVTVSEPVFFRARFSKMAASRNVLCSMLLGLLSSLIACLELNVAMLNLNFNYLRRRLWCFLTGIFFALQAHVLKPQVNKQESRGFGTKIITASAFFVMRMLC